MYRVKSTFFFTDDVKQSEVTEKLGLLKMVHPLVYDAFITKCKNPQVILYGNQKEILQRWSPSFQQFVLGNGVILESVRSLLLKTTGELEPAQTAAKGSSIRARL